MDSNAWILVFTHHPEQMIEMNIHESTCKGYFRLSMKST